MHSTAAQYRRVMAANDLPALDIAAVRRIAPSFVPRAAVYMGCRDDAIAGSDAALVRAVSYLDGMIAWIHDDHHSELSL